MRIREAVPFDWDGSNLPNHEIKFIDTFLDRNTSRAEKLFWLILGLVRRNEANPGLVAQARALPPNRLRQMTRLAHQWLAGPELDAFKSKLRVLIEHDVKSLSIKLPFAKIRAFQELMKMELKKIL